MPKQTKYPVHPDFSHYPSFSFPFNGVITAALNQFLHLDTFFRQRHLKNKAKLHFVPSSDGTVFKVYQFNPDGAGVEEQLPAVIYYHGGAFVLTYASTHVQAVDTYAQRARCRVFLVDYRLAPKHVFPAGFNDCYAALEWVHRNAAKLGIDANKIAVMGDSAGGCFSAGVAQKALDEQKINLAGQLLIYPALDWRCSSYSARTYLDAPMFNGQANKRMWQVYLRNSFGQPAVPPYASPADRSSLKGLPKAYVETAEFDPLCDEGADYAKRLQEAGVEVLLHEPKGTVHGYDTVPESEITKDAVDKRLEFLTSIFYK